ncbi:uncharacterized protein B0H64DRAFT_471935 [Chaetomium fimeti]|uniref:gamma-glutamylcyclotransferase n=1 Tax=Chaetomium fimeti TaxID=1854472 RepID=A0AAE0HLK2_9PEZI|nr:hypothetical protein B0H64DRAFT_471935 [Chaetomium fimeti]
MAAKQTLYFAFGSNLWQHQMSLRCPNSPFIGLARLRGYKWFINARGYANIAPVTTNPTPSPQEDDNQNPYANEVWGLVYTLSPPDEAQLDRNEGVPTAYQKELVSGIDFWPASNKPNTTPNTPDGTSNFTAPMDMSVKPTPTKMLVYVDHHRNTGGHRPRDEYVRRMNMGIRDALREGVPRGYVDGVVRGYIPEEEELGFGVGCELGGEMEKAVMRRAAGLDRDGDVAGDVDGAGVDGVDGVKKGGEMGLVAAAVAGPAGSGVVSAREGEEGGEELPERASEVCYLREHGL